MINKIIIRTFLFAGLVSISFTIGAQTADEDLYGRVGSRYIITSVPFITFAPDARASAMGDVGVATSPDANSMHWNASKLAFIENKKGFSMSYSPWLRNLVNDMYLAYLTGYTKIRKEETVGLALRYFDLGSMTFTDNRGDVVMTHNPRELEITGAYARQLSQKLALSIGLKFIHSNLTGGYSNSGGASRPGNTVAADISSYYTNDDIVIKGYPVRFSAGVNLSNIGGKISYSGDGNGNFIPANFRVGVTGETEIDQYNKIGLSLDFNKLMVPTPPIYATDSTTDEVYVVEGRDPRDLSTLSSIFGSFADAPGGFREELKEFTVSVGAEYWYTELFAVRAGYFYEHVDKGGRKYFTVGLGVKYQLLQIDMSYLIPQFQNHPLQNTLRFTLSFNFGEADDAETVTEGS